MKTLLIIILIIFTVNSNSQDVYVERVNREVYINDTLYLRLDSSECKNTFMSNWQSNQIIDKIDELVLTNEYIDTSTAKDNKYVIYEIVLSNGAKVILKSNISIQMIDYAIMFGSDYLGDETFLEEWWYEEGEFNTIVIPSHPNRIILDNDEK
ncbi:MAG: hypothetical protein ACE364_04745 [Chlorobiota bacterium]